MGIAVVVVVGVAVVVVVDVEAVVVGLVDGEVAAQHHGECCLECRFTHVSMANLKLGIHLLKFRSVND